MALDLREFELANVARMHAENMLREQNYPESASALFPKIISPDPAEANNPEVSVYLPIPNMQEIQMGQNVPIPVVDKAFENLYLINEPVESDDSEEDSTDNGNERPTTAKPKLYTSDLFQFGIL